MHVFVDTQPASLTLAQWTALRAAMVDTPFIKTITLLRQTGNRPQRAELLFADAVAHGVRITRARLQFNNLMRQRKMGFQLSRFDCISAQSPRLMEYALVERVARTSEPWKESGNGRSARRRSRAQ